MYTISKAVVVELCAIYSTYPLGSIFWELNSTLIICLALQVAPQSWNQIATLSHRLVLPVVPVNTISNKFKVCDITFCRIPSYRSKASHLAELGSSLCCLYCPSIVVCSVREALPCVHMPKNKNKDFFNSLASVRCLLPREHDLTRIWMGSQLLPASMESLSQNDRQRSIYRELATPALRPLGPSGLRTALLVHIRLDTCHSHSRVL